MSTIQIKQLGDLHRGCAVSVVQKQDGTKWVCKPRSLAVDVIWSRFCSWAHEQGMICAPRPVATYEDQCGGYCEFIAYTPLPSKEAATRYYKRCGGLLCVAYLLGSRDLHCENLIAHGEYPVIVDLETMLAGEVRSFMEPLDAAAPDDPMGYIRDSVLYTSLLPHHVRLGSETADTSGFAGQLEGGLAPCQNVPFLPGGERIGPEHYVDEIVQGFQEAYQWICAHKEKILYESPYKQFAKCPIRFLIRNTQVYARLISRLQMQDMQENPELYERQLSKLALAYTKYAHPSVLDQVLKLYEAEAAAIRRGDVPYFFAYADETAIRDENGKVVYEHYFRKSAFARSNEVLEKMSEEDCALQCDLIRASFHAAYPMEGFEETDRRASVLLLDAVVDIKCRLMQQAFVAADRAPAWLIPCGSADGASGVTVTGPGLYSGRVGVALFFAALWSVGGDREARNTACSLAQAVIAQIEKSFSNQVYLSTSLGYANGLGGLLAALWDISHYLKQPELFPTHWVDRISPEWIREDRDYDVLGGSAGLLLALDRIGCTDSERISWLAEHIMQERIEWQEHLLIHHPEHESQPLNGFGHGACGIAVALHKAAEATGICRFSEAADDLLKYVDECFDCQKGNWPDFRLREERNEVAFMHGWCSGAPGIGIGYQALGLNADRALKWVQDCTLLTRDTLCCGNSTLIDFLALFGFEDDARILADQLTKRSKCYRIHGYQGTHVRDVGLFSGLSGVGFAFLRAMYPEQVRSILI